MAKKNGIGATSGKKASTFEATMPDGSVVRKKSFFIHTDTAYIAAYEHNGKWETSGVVAMPQEWGNQKFFEAKKIQS